MKDEKLKIFIVNQFFPEDFLGGSEIQCLLLAKYLPTFEHETRYVAVSNPKFRELTVKQKNFKLKYLSRGRRVSFRNFVSFYKLLKKEKPDVCYIRIFRFAFLLSFACRLARVPAVFNTSTLRDCMPYIEGMFKFSLNPVILLKQLRFMVQRYLNWYSLKKMRVVTINKVQAKILNKRGIKATPIYNSMEDNYKKYRNIKKNQIVWVNNIKKRKNPESYLNLVKKFMGSGWKFLMIGYFYNEVEYYKRLIDETKRVNPNFEYLGGIAPWKVDEILAESKIFVNTCEVEGFGNNFIQAWLAECPTITLKFDPDDIIKNNKLGFYSVTQKKMEEDLGKLIRDDNLRKDMGKRARKWAKENNNINFNKLKYEKIFKEVVYE